MNEIVAVVARECLAGICSQSRRRPTPPLLFEGPGPSTKMWLVGG